MPNKLDDLREKALKKSWAPPAKTQSRGEKIFAGVWKILLLNLWLLICWWVFLAPPSISYTNLPFPLVNDILHPGDPVAMHVSRCNTLTSTKTYTSTREIVNIGTDESIFLPSTTLSAVPGCISYLNQIITLPHDLPVGRYLIRGIVEISGAFSTKHVKWYTDPFTVIQP